MSETKYSSNSSPADSWAHEFYNQGATMFDIGRDRVSSEATVISANTASGSTAANVPSHHGSSSSSQYLNVPVDQGAGGGGAGRGSKPIRRRSRASRRTPTTLLNTDTTNFRAMVQQFTGGPTAPYASTATGSHAQYPFPRAGSSFSFGPAETRNQVLNPVPSSFYHLQFQQQQHQQQQQQQQHQHEQYFQQQQQQQHQPYMFSFMNNSRPDMEDINVDHGAPSGFSIDHVPYPLPPSRPPSSLP
ncbi:hypothetical protein RHSIM_Rhsim12G0015000 [Rhododendron simsii]|uniref:VQ domain-containing protein n=1 Tax=Rhododendron simsii TaxID=118357 RepID=A0A834GAE1_RHOSS|nr:hypothetical protein RHSIM_Rhsim12G0015000 [Rhododendron simsii]